MRFVTAATVAVIVTATSQWKTFLIYKIPTHWFLFSINLKREHLRAELIKQTKHTAPAKKKATKREKNMNEAARATHTHIH